MICTKTLVAKIEFDERDVLAFIEQADVVLKLFLIKRTIDALTPEELKRLEEYLTTGLGAQASDGETMKLFNLLKQLKVELDSI
jgi:hypothetical protein